MNISYKLKDLENKTIIKIETMKAEYGRTYDKYLCFTCEDGSRIMLHGGEPHYPIPSIEEMRKVNFYTPEEIGKRLELIEKEKRQREKELLNNKKQQLQKLKEELGES